ncbi:flavodoxin family protein [Dawidia cretensis]|nr:flavodoxin [Dawidia cretensis]
MSCFGKCEMFCFNTRLIALLLLLPFGCSSQGDDAGSEKTVNRDAEKILVVYLTRTNNTKAIAEIIHAKIGGTLVGLELQNPYPEDYKATVAQVAKENETGFLPPLKTRIENIESFDLIFVGFPTWGMQLPPPMKSFLKQYDLSGKTIVPFNTNGGYGIGSTFDTVKQLCKNSTIMEGFSMKGGVERDGILFVIEGEKERQAREEVDKWLRKLNLLN